MIALAPRLPAAGRIRRVLDPAKRPGKGRSEVEILDAGVLRGEPDYNTKLLRFCFGARLTIPGGPAR